MKNISIFFLSVAFFFSCGSEVKTQKLMEFFPATSFNQAGVNVFSPKTAELKQYYVKDGKWVHNKNVPSLKPTIKGGDYRMQYLPSPTGGSPNLFLYSANSGEYEFYYLAEGMWKINTLLPGGKVNFKSKDIKMEFTSGSASSTAYMFAHTGNGKELRLMEIQDGKWVYISYFPSSL